MKYIILILVVILSGCASTGGDNWSSIMSSPNGRSAIIYVPNMMMYNNTAYPVTVNQPHVHNTNRDAYIVPCMTGPC